MASGRGSPVRDKAEWLLRFAGMSLATPRDFRRLRVEAHRWLDPDGARPLEWGELRAVQAHLQGGLKALRQKQPWEHRVQGTHVLLPGDRKSTRLNSSHSQISYAVFCLKKKKKNDRTTR